MVKKFTASVVGGGGGGRLSIDGLVNSDRFDFVAVTDLRPEVCKELEKNYPGIKTFTDHKEMFKKCPTDIVCVSTWAPSHESVTMDALNMLPLKGILVEKPLGDTVKAGRNIIDAIKKKNLPMATPHGLLVKKHSLEILDRVHRGEIGELKLVEIQNSGWDMFNAGIHWLNYFVNLAQLEPMDFVMSTCESSTRTYRDGMQVGTTEVTYAQTKSGVRVVMNTGDYVNINEKDHGSLFRIIGTKGMITFFGWEEQYVLLNAEYPQGKQFLVKEPKETLHIVHLENMAKMIDAGKPDYTIPESSLIALEIVEGGYLASRHNCKVTFPVDKFVVPQKQSWDPGMPYSGKGGGRDGRKLP